jgi:hypothetical protein
MRFFYDGQFEGRRVKLPVQLGRWPDEPADATTRSLYDRLLGTAAEAVFHAGEWRLLPVSAAGDDSSSDLVAYRWRDGAALSVVVANAGGRVAQGHVSLGDDVPDAKACDFEDRLTDTRYRWTRDLLVSPGLYVRLEPGRAHVFSVHAIA